MQIMMEDGSLNRLEIDLKLWHYSSLLRVEIGFISDTVRVFGRCLVCIYKLKTRVEKSQRLPLFI